MNIDKEQVKKSFKKSMHTYDEHALMQREICCRLVELIDAYAKCTYDNVYEIGCGTGMLTKMLVEDFTINKLFLNDIVPQMESKLSGLLDNKKYSNYSFLAGDAERMDIPEACELIISASAFQWFDDLEAVSEKILNSLSDKGFLIYNSFGENNFKEIRDITGGGLEYRSFNMMQDILGKYFNLKHSENIEKRLYFDTPIDILKHLRLTGVNATRVQKTWTKSTLKDFEERYKAKYSDDKGVYLTYNPVYFVCHK